MLFRKLFALSLVLAIGTIGVSAQQAGERMVGVKDEGGARGARLDELRTAGFDALYNLDYETARKTFREIVRLFPDHPAGHQFLAAALWAKALNESRRLQSTLYNTDSFYEPKKEDKPDPRMVEEFRGLTRTASQLARARLRRDPKDIEALYFLGATEGIKAAFATTIQRSFMSALGDGSSSVDRHREVIKLDPSFHDAELTIGFYDYVVGSLPGPVKLLASMVGTRGSKKRGLAALERVATQGRWAKDDARALLIVLFKREKRYADALGMARELAAKYTRNYLFKLEAADALVSLAAAERGAGREAEAKKAEAEALAIFEALVRDRSAGRSLDRVHFLYGEALLGAGQPESAAKEFLAAAAVTGADPDAATAAHLRAARAYDLAGKRPDAMAQYRIVLARPDSANAHDQARQGLKEPYKLKNNGKSVSE